MIGGFNMKFMWVLLTLASLSAPAAETTLTIVAGDQRLAFTQSQLLARSDVQTLSVTGSVYKQRLTQFKAIPMRNLFVGVTIPDLAVIQCNAVDGFSVVLDNPRLFSTKAEASKAYLAIEDPNSPWPSLAGKATSAGPFYLVWTHPQASAIGREEWPFQIASFIVLSDVRRAFPNAVPTEGAVPAVQNGFKVFLKNCFACHKVNGEGAGSIGPDLNLPMNPTEYFDAQALASYIRDPASVRAWPGMAMRGFSAGSISDADLSDLLAYLRFMTSHKVKP
jgi:mono/diheme cytochrome c family protein